MPGPSDNVTIDVVGDITVTFSTGTTTIHSLQSKEAFVVSGGTLSIAAASEISNTFTLSGGTLDGSGDLVVRGLFTWTGGTMSGLGRTIIDTAATIGGNGSLMDRTLENLGTVNWVGSNLGICYKASILNQGLFIAHAGNTIGSNGWCVPGSFENRSVFQKVEGSGTLVFETTLNNSGSIELQTGTLLIQGRGSTSGTIMGAVGTALVVANAHTFGATSRISVPDVSFGYGSVGVDVNGTYEASNSTRIASKVNFNPGATIVNAGSTVTITGVANFNTGAPITTANLLLTGAGELTGTSDVTVSQYLEWTGGTMSGSGHTIANAEMLISGWVVIQDTRTLDNWGTATWNSSGVWMSSGAVINNESGALLDVYAPTGLLIPSGTINNSGEFRLSAGTSTMELRGVFNNTGWVNLQSGTLNLWGSASSGTFTGVDGATLHFCCRSHMLNTSSSVSVPNVIFDASLINVNGTYNVADSTSFAYGPTNFNSGATLLNLGNVVTVSAGLANFNPGVPITLTNLVMSGGQITGTSDITLSRVMTWTAGTMSGLGKTINTGVMYLGVSPRLSGHTLNNAGIVNWIGGTFFGDSGAIINNLAGAIFDAQADTTLWAPLGLTFNNAGEFRKSAGAGTTWMNGTFNNTGQVNMQTGTLMLWGGRHQQRHVHGRGGKYPQVLRCSQLYFGHGVKRECAECDFRLHSGQHQRHLQRHQRHALRWWRYEFQSRCDDRKCWKRDYHSYWHCQL